MRPRILNAANCIIMKEKTMIYRLLQTLLILLLASTGVLIFWPVPAPAATTTIPAFSHIFTIVLENKEFDTVIGSNQAPYFNQLAQTYGLATQSYGELHPSLPNYIALTSGSTQGITTDCTTCFVDAPNLIDQLDATGHSWKAYMESMPSSCFVGDSGSLYRQKHNPFIYYNNIRTNPTRCNKIVPFGQFATDLQANALSDYVWITPNMCDDMHDCPVTSGDTWLKTWVPEILASPAWQQNGLLLITFDEGSTNAGCCTNAVGGRIATLVISPLDKPSYKSAVSYDQYSLLRTVEDAWGLPLLANAASPHSPNLSDFFIQPAAVPTATATAVSTVLPTATALATPSPTTISISTPTSTPVGISARIPQLWLPSVIR